MKEELLIEIATYHSSSTLICKSQILIGWVIALIVQATHIASCPGATKILNKSTVPTLFALVRTWMSG